MLNQTSGPFALVIYLVLLAAIFYFMIIVPQRKRAKERQQLLETLKVSDEVVTVGGVYGIVTAIKDDVVMLKVDDKVILKVAKDAVGAITTTTVSVKGNNKPNGSHKSNSNKK